MKVRKSQMKIPENVLSHIRAEAEQLRYGKIIIEINETSKTIDIVTEARERFAREEHPHKPGTDQRNG